MPSESVSLPLTHPVQNPVCNNSLRVSPCVGEFSDIGCDLIYVIRFTIFNTSNKVRRVRFRPPENSVFTLVTHPHSIAPGLRQEIEVEFCTKDARDYNDSFHIVSDEGRLEVPLHAWFPRPCIHFKDEIDLGIIPVQHNASHTFTLTNTGTSPGSFTFKSDGLGAGLAVTPPSGTVPPGKSKEVQVNYFGSEPGLFVSVVQVSLPQQSTRQLKVTAKVVESKVDILNDVGVPMTGNVLDFGTLYYGQKRTVEVQLVNGSPFSTSFTVHSPENNGEDADDEDRPSTPAPPPIEANPTDGRILKLQSAKVKFCFQPLYQEAKTGFLAGRKKPETGSWRQTFGVEVAETEQRMDLVLTGRAVHPDVTLNQNRFVFADTAVNDHIDMLCTVTNSAELPVDINASNVAHFHVRSASHKCSAPWRLQSHSEMNLVITFRPNQLGKFTRTINLSLNGGITTVPMSVIGVSSKLGAKRELVGGPTALEADFEKKLKYSHDREKTEKKVKSNDPPWMSALSSLSKDHPSDMPCALQLQEIIQHREHKQLYNKYLSDERTNREYLQKVAVDAKLAAKEAAAGCPDRAVVDIGMIPAEGLHEPIPVVPKKLGDSKVDTDRGRADTDGGRMLTKTTKFDENRLIKKKFKKEPLALNEQRECKMVLPPKDISHVSYGPRLLDFGKVTVFSRNVKSFCVQNTLKSHIQVRIPVALRDELKQSYPASQVIPPGQTAGFDIVFKSDAEQTFTQAMWFQLNESHKLKFLLHAEAIPVDLSLSQEKMDFRFNEFVLDSTLTQNLTLTNHGNAEASFKWVCEDGEGSFTFTPEADTIPPLGQRNIEITYTPLQSNESRSVSQLLVEGGPTRKLHLTGSVQEAKCAFSTQKIDFGSVAVGSSVTKTVAIRSLGPSSTVFTIAALPQGLTASITRNRLAVNQSLDIQLTLRPSQATSMQSQVTCNVRGMKQPLRLAVKADPRIPRVELHTPQGLDFGKVIVGTHEYRELGLVNVGGIPSTMLLDMTEVPDFQLCDADLRPVESATEPEDDEVRDGVMVVCRDTDGEEGDETPDEEDGGSSQEDLHDKRGKKYRIVVCEKATLKCFVRFTPTAVQPHTFPLLLSLAGIPVAETSHELMKQVSAEALKPRLVLSHNAVDFGSRVVVKDGTSKANNIISLRLTNEMAQDLQWDMALSEDPLMAEIFRLTPTSGTLAPGHSSSVQVSFFPAEVRTYQMRVGVCLDGNKTRRYMDLVVTGNGSNPALTFDRRELILPTVPLDVPAKATFVITNEGYETLELRYRLPGAAKWNEPGTLPISIAFPDGSVLGHHHTQLVVEVTCLSKKPVSFTAAIDFCDEEDGIFSMPVSFTTDNSLLTSFPFFATHKAAENSHSAGYSFYAESDKKPVMLRCSDLPETGAMTPKMTRSEAPRSHAGSGYDTDQTNTYKVLDKTNRKAFTKRHAERIKTWLNNFILQDPIDDLVGGLAAANGKVFIEVIEQLVGRVPTGMLKPDKVASLPKRDAANAIFKQYEDIILFLKGYGAMLIDVRPEFLIRYEDHQRILSPQKGWGAGLGASAPTSQSRPGERSKPRLSERKFGYKQLHAWTTLILQVLRVFVVNKITWKQLKSLPNNVVTQKAAIEERWSSLAQDPSTLNSNVYSASEAILLKWLNLHQAHFIPRHHQRILSFDELRDCRAFSCALAAYIPTLAARMGLVASGGSNGGSSNGALMAHPASIHDCERNATLFLESAKSYGIDFKVTPKELVESTSRDLLLISVNLFQTLPQFIPQATVTFSGILNETITKTIELNNPHRWPIDYLVLLDDESGEFKIDKADNKLRLESRCTAQLPIWICPHFSKKTRGRLTFLSVGRLGPNMASTIVFNVETDIDTEQGSVVHVETPLYEPLSYELEFENPFSERANFNVQYQQSYVREVDKKGHAITYGEEASVGSYQDAFWTAQDVINVKKNDKAKLVMQFIPFVRGNYSCKVTLSDEKVGEVIHIIKGTALHPVPFEKVSFQTELATPQSKDIVVPQKNVSQEKGATVLHNERFKGFKSKMKGTDKHDKSAEVNVKYKVEYSSPFFTGPKELAMVGEKTEEEPKKKGVPKGQLSLHVTFQPKGPGVYPGRITLTSDGDVRIIDIEGKSRSPGMKADLEFICNARQVIQQELPLTNKTAKDWTIQAVLTGEYFSGAREIVVKAGKTKNYLLSFQPAWVCDVKGQLLLKNTDTLEKYTYHLHARADEPLAESTLNTECIARSSTTLVIDVPNITSDDVLYSVETDVPFARGAPSLLVPKLETGKYSLLLKPTLSGKTTGSITFSTPTEQYVWFVIQVQASRPPPEKTIEIRATVRKALIAEISIGNPTDNELSFLVRRRGEGLLGEDRIIVDAGDTGVYNLIYNPLRSTPEGVPSDGQVSFFNDELGEHWYALKLTADEAEPEELPEAHCELGKSKPIQITLENPVEQELSLAVTVSNPQNFTISPATMLTLKPFGKAHPVVTYMPSAIAQRQEALVTFVHPKYGKWEYIVRGKGAPPTLMEPITVTAVATRSQQTSIVFRNPFPLPRRFLISLKADGGGVEPEDSPFELMVRRKTTTVGPFSSLTLALSYSPTIIDESRTTVVVQAVGEGVSDDLKWEYPVIGVAEAVPQDNVYRFSTKCRSELSQTVSLALHNLALTEDERFTHEIVFPESHRHLKAMQTSIVVQAAHDKPSVQGDVVKLDFTVAFTPLRPYQGAVELLVKKKSGGIWRFEMHFEATPPPPDDTIVMQAAVAQRGGVGFALSNVFPEELPFKAYFTSDSAAEFTVSPAKGMLAPAAVHPHSTAPTQFVVSFSSSQYGKTLNGMLVIESELIEWRYDVKGMFFERLTLHLNKSRHIAKCRFAVLPFWPKSQKKIF